MKLLRCMILTFLLLYVFPAIKASGIVRNFTDSVAEQKRPQKNTIVLYGQASFYAARFHGRKTASGEIFNHSKYTAACNMLRLGTLVRVTNLKNGKVVFVKINDRLHNKTSRLLDLTKEAAGKLGFIKAGLTRVKIEVVEKEIAK